MDSFRPTFFFSFCSIRVYLRLSVVKYFYVLAIFILCALGLLTACSKATEDTTYLTPIPEATLSAFHQQGPIETKLQAVIAARIQLMGPPHFKPVGTPTTLFAEELRLADAYRFVNVEPYYFPPDRVADTQVWLVVFEGEIQVTPPGQHEPNPPFHSCSYVIIPKDGRQSNGIVGGVDCAQPATWQIK
jgi:hypothetical protein